MKEMIKRSCFVFVFFTLLCGGVYPLFVTVIGQVFFNESANGSIITQDGEKIGSKYIGQYFTEETHFWSRPSISDYMISIGSNKGVEDEELKKEQEELKQYLISTSRNEKEVPKDLYTFSASGMDPNISLESAFFQEDRIADAKGLDVSVIHTLIEDSAIYSGVLGTNMVNVLELNLKLDKIKG